MLPMLAAATVAASAFAAFEGRWRCEGRFAASDKHIASELTMATDAASGVFIVRHDDRAPAAYHSVETWTTDPGDGGGLHSAIADRFSGLRVFRSPPIHDGVIAFVRPEGESPQEEFRYILTDPITLRIEWSVSRQGQPLRLGDTLTCRRKEG